jgi:hypothetical protein
MMRAQFLPGSAVGGDHRQAARQGLGYGHAEVFGAARKHEKIRVTVNLPLSVSTDFANKDEVVLKTVVVDRGFYFSAMSIFIATGDHHPPV